MSGSIIFQSVFAKLSLCTVYDDIFFVYIVVYLCALTDSCGQSRRGDSRKNC
jgi:cytochrome c biogenesis protein ResB